MNKTDLNKLSSIFLNSNESFVKEINRKYRAENLLEEREKGSSNKFLLGLSSRLVRLLNEVSICLNRKVEIWVFNLELIVRIQLKDRSNWYIIPANDVNELINYDQNTIVE